MQETDNLSGRRKMTYQQDCRKKKNSSKSAFNTHDNWKRKMWAHNLLEATRIQSLFMAAKLHLHNTSAITQG